MRKFSPPPRCSWLAAAERQSPQVPPVRQIALPEWLSCAFGLPLQVEGFKAKGLEDRACFKMKRSRVRRQRVKTLGVIGGIGPESTIEYYRLLIRAYRARVPDGSNPPILINSINMKHLVTLIERDEFGKITDYLVGEIQKLAAGGADCGLLSANTPHVVFDEISQRSPIPLVSIVEATCDAARASGLKR